MTTVTEGVPQLNTQAALRGTHHEQGVQAIRVGVVHAIGQQGTERTGGRGPVPRYVADDLHFNPHPKKKNP